MANRSNSEPVDVADRDVVVGLVGMRGDLADLHGDLQLLVAMVDALLTIAKQIQTRMPPAAPPDGAQDGRAA